MEADSGTTGIPVEMLRPGLYVRALDRPWVETPFPFQGFRIVGAEELEALREYCRVVYIDAERSDAKALAAVRGGGDGRDARPGATSAPGMQPGKAARAVAKRPSERARRRSAGALFAETEHPDRKRFSTLVQAADAARGEARSALGDAFARAVRGRMVDTARIDGAADELAGLVGEDPTASLWLTRLRERRDGMAEHAVNTAVLSLALAAYRGMDQRGLRRLGVGALLHEVGKTTLPRSILRKPGPLSEAERARVREYPRAGCELVAESGHVHSESLEVIRLHRERRDGSGYPRGLQGEGIPQQALIAGLADVYDTMTSKRPRVVAPDRALNELHSEWTGQFGAELVQGFIRCLGIFPVGSVVELDNGARVVVVGARPGRGLWPTVLMVRTPAGEACRKRVLLNLGAPARKARRAGNRRVARSVEASAAGIDVAGIVGAEFGLGA